MATPRAVPLLVLISLLLSPSAQARIANPSSRQDSKVSGANERWLSSLRGRDTASISTATPPASTNTPTSLDSSFFGPLAAGAPELSPPTPEFAPVPSSPLESIPAPAPSPAAHIPTASSVVCPPSASAVCDFYFPGMGGTIPRFAMGGGGADEVLQSGIEAFVYGHNVTIISVNSWGASFVCPGAVAGMPDAGDQFYISQDKLFCRTLQASPGANYYVNRALLLPLSSVELSVDDQVLNLEAGDGNQDFPEARRCVMFEVSL